MTRTLVRNNQPVVLAITILTFNRIDRLNICLRCLYSTILHSQYNAQIIIMDNSHGDDVFLFVEKFCARFNKISLKYLKKPKLNQSQLRNLALKIVPIESKYLMFLDSDIYLSKYTLSKLLFYLDNYKIDAIAPPLFSYYGGRHAQFRNDANLKDKRTAMPDEHDRLNNNYIKGMLLTKMLRGVFVLNRQVLDKFSDQSPWLESFQVWQNVPFFLTLKENGGVFGYLMDSAIIALHDERKNKFTIKSSMLNWHMETLKSIVLIFFRNKLWLDTQQALNKRFLSELRRVVEYHLNSASEIYPECFFKLAKCLELPEKQGKEHLQKLECAKIGAMRELVDLLICSDWHMLKKIKSSNLEVEI